ncbi:outer membrane beta-barrel protein [bacterium]|nr:MAG: outer membrane beta-barrel protein [bacterium]
MKTIITLLFVLILTGISHSQDKKKVGLGMSIGTTTFYAAANQTPTRLVFTSIYLPIHISDKFKIEPELGFTHYTASSDYSDQSNTGIKFGIGFFGKKPIEQTHVYYGVRLGIIRESEDYSYDGYGSDKEKSTHKFIGPAFGAEHFFSPAFSFGGETQFIYTIFDTGSSSFDLNSLDNRVHLFLRWYWN